MNRKLVAGVLGAVLAAFLIWFLGFRDKGDHPTTPRAAGSGAIAKFDPRARPGAPAEATPEAGPSGWDVDPVGALALEGQVLDDHDDPVKGAIVSLSSAPGRTTKSDDDGTFAFDKLVTRSYAVSARADDLYGGPVLQQLTATSPPVVIRMSRGATLTVHVRADGDARPIQGATVELRTMSDQTASTDAAGDATFRGVSPGWVQVVATAEGYAAGDAGSLIGTGAAAANLTVLMHHGAAVSGRVVDEQGQPVAEAYVLRQDAGRAWQFGDLDKDAVKTSAKGEFRFPIVPAGSFRFVARHDRLAPGSSTPVTVDGSHETKGVEIVMKQGGVITGVVVAADGTPAAHAGVSVAPKEVVDFQNWGGMRRVTADAKGEFEIRALPRQNVRVRAESVEAASAIAEVDLTGANQSQKLRLVLDVSGTIAGTVVDSAGQPVPEVQVVAVMDLWGGNMENYALSGFSTATTDGGGAFAIHGLADGEYQLSAHRSGMDAQASWGEKGTTAKTGATSVRLVLPTPGSIKGKLVLAAGGVPKLATVSIGWRKSTPAIDGVFELTDVEPGEHDLTVRGPEFAEKTERDVTVTAGKATDAGTIKLVRGRRLVGTVVDSSGKAVAGATVRVGRMIFTEGGKAGGGDENLEQLWGLRVATTGEDGGFAIVGVSKDGGSVVAEHPDFGRSEALKVAAGTGDPAEVKLVLHGFGSIAGVVTSKGQPLQAMVMATPKGSGAQFVSVQSGPDGAYVIEKVAEGTHRLTAMRLGMTSMTSSDGVEVVVKAGERVSKNLDIPSGDLTVAIEIKAKAGAKLDAAQVFLFRGTVAAKTAKDLTEAFTSGGAAAGGMQFWMGQGNVTFAETLPGHVSICSIPITGDLRDPKVQERLQKHGDLLGVYCMGLDLPASPKQQTYPQELPAMNALPED